MCILSVYTVTERTHGIQAYIHSAARKWNLYITFKLTIHPPPTPTAIYSNGVTRGKSFLVLIILLTPASHRKSIIIATLPPHTSYTDDETASHVYNITPPPPPTRKRHCYILLHTHPPLPVQDEPSLINTFLAPPPNSHKTSDAIE